jgi:peptidoglycan/xylan/chitin deacetylase (PgdA/CDA1 family)
MDNAKKGLIVIIAAVVFGFIIFSFTNIEESNKQACLSLTFDDGLKSHYDVAYPILKEKNFGATFFIVGDHSALKKKFVYDKELMTSEQIQELSDSGFEIGSHTMTHPFLPHLTEEDIEKELKDSKEILEETYDVEMTSLAFPRWGYNEEVSEIAQKYYIHARPIFNTKPKAFVSESFGFKNDTTYETVCGHIRTAKNRGYWLVLSFHDVVEKPTLWDTSIYNFEKIMECAEESDIEVSSFRGCKDKIK